MRHEDPNRWNRPAPERELPPACVDRILPDEDGVMPEPACHGSCIPGGCAMAVGCSPSRRPTWWMRGLTVWEEMAMDAIAAGTADGNLARIVADGADECWRAGCPLPGPEAHMRRDARVPGCPGFCDALPPHAAWRLDGWLRELDAGEAAAVAHVALGFRSPSDLEAVEALADECREGWPCAELPWMPEPAYGRGCPGFCQLASAGRWS